MISAWSVPATLMLLCVVVAIAGIVIALCLIVLVARMADVVDALADIAWELCQANRAVDTAVDPESDRSARPLPEAA